MSNTSSLVNDVIANLGGIAQLAERLLCKQEVSGSIPDVSILLGVKSKFEKTCFGSLTVRGGGFTLLDPMRLGCVGEETAGWVSAYFGVFEL